MNMKRIGTIVALAGILVLATGAAALAQSPDPVSASAPPPAKVQVLRGEVLGKQARSFGLLSPDGQRHVVQVTDQTRFAVPGKAGARFKHLQTGDKVLVLGRKTTDGFVARSVRITLHGRVERLAGEVTAAGAAGFTVKTLAGDTVRVLVTDKTVFLPKGAEVKAGDKVAVTGIRLANEDRVTARLVLVKKGGKTSTTATNP
jgi:hypothetical protein